jgi:L-alanine-DL-glutamate epimerase-like enolase superfamily enzyme
MTRAYIAAVNPQDVAREVERQAARGFRFFVLRRVAGGGMLDQERLGAARYAAGLQAYVMLEAPEDVPAAAAR